MCSSDLFDIEDRSASGGFDFELYDMFGNIDDDAGKVLRALIEDPSVVTDKGYLKIESIRKPTGLSAARVRKSVDIITKILEKEYGQKN